MKFSIYLNRRVLVMFWTVKDIKIFHKDNTESNQIAGMRKLSPQSDSSLRWAHESKGTFSNVAADNYIMYNAKNGSS